MAAQSTTLPALTIGHQLFLERLILSLEADGMASCNIAVLRQLAASMPGLRSSLPADIRGQLDEIDQTMAAYSGAVESLNEGLNTFQLGKGASQPAANHMLDSEYIAGFARQAHELSQLAAEAALRANHLTDQLSRLNT